MTCAKTFFPIFALGSILVGCGGGGGGGGGNNSSGNGNTSTLNARAENVAGKLTITWHDQRLELDQNNNEGNLASNNTERSEVAIIESPDFQDCSNNQSYTSNDNLNYELIIRCDNVVPHRLYVNSSGLEGDLSLSWEGQTIALTPTNPSVQLESTLASFSAPEILVSPTFQSCNSTLDSAGVNYFLEISCSEAIISDRQTINIVNTLSFPVQLSFKNQIFTVSNESVSIEQSGGRSDEMIIDALNGSQFCSIEKADLDSENREQRWTLACQEFQVVELDDLPNQPGFYLILDNGERIFLASSATDSTRSPTYIYTEGSRIALINRSFGARELKYSARTGLESWTPINDLPDNAGLNDIIQTATAIYLQYKAGDIESIWRLSEGFNARVLAGILNRPNRTGGMNLGSYQDDIIVAYQTTVPSNTWSAHRFINGRARPTIDLLSVSFNPLQLAYYDNFWFLFQANDTDDTIDIGRLTGYHFGSSNLAYVPAGIDSELNVVNWVDKDNIKHVWAIGGYLLDGSSTERKFAGLVVDSQENTIRWEPVDLLTNSTYGYMGTDGKLLAVTGDNNSAKDQLVELFNNNGRVDLSGLPITQPVRVKPKATLINLPTNVGVSNPPTYMTTSIHNGWLLLFSGSNDLGSVWVTNGSLDRTYRVKENISWDEFLEFQIVWGGDKLVSVVSNTQETLLLGIPAIP